MTFVLAMSPLRTSSLWGSQSRINTTTYAPSASRRLTSHEPTMPLAPVTNTRRSAHADFWIAVISTPHLPRGRSRGPQILEQPALAKRVHRLPEAVVTESHQ